MKVVHIQTGMPLAGNAAYRLHKALMSIGIGSSIVTYMPAPKKNNVYSIPKSSNLFLKKIINYIYNKLFHNISKSIKPEAYFYSPLPICNKHLSNNKLIKEADAIYVHTINGGFLGISDFEDLARTGKPIFFFMHDMWTFTGGCHHSFECEQYQNGCKQCAMFNKNSKFAKKQNAAKEKVFNKYDNIHFISPSKWMQERAIKSNILKNKNIYHISNIVDEKIFKPLDTNTAREILNLPKDKKLITFGCQAGTKNRFKGWEYLRDAINSLDIDNLELVIYGSEYNKQTEDELKYPIHFLGALNDETMLSLVCNATDVFVSPSLAESFGLTLLENTLCGTPVVAFDCTAIPEIVNINPNGYLASYKDHISLAYGIKQQLNSKKSTDGITYSSKSIAFQHKELIERLTNINH